MTLLLYVAWPLLGIAVCGLVFWGAVAARLRQMRVAQCTIREGVRLDKVNGDQPLPLVSIVVPAHNEERGIDACAASLRAQRYESLEIIFVLDRCTDGTLEILRRHQASDPRIVLVENDDCPDDWAGKCNAARRGADRASGAYLLFTDGDTVFDPDLVRAAVALARDRDLGLLSILSTLTFARRFERVVQPVASMSLISMFPVQRVNRRGGARPFANGQFMLFARDWYERIGGHAAVKSDLLEDIAFARRLDDAGGAGGIFFADGMLTCSMYDSLDGMKLGWKRIFIEACKRKPGRLRKNGVRTLLAGVGLPAAQTAALGTGVALLFGTDVPLGVTMTLVVIATWLIQFASLARIYSLSGAPPHAALLYPIGSWIVAGIMFEGAGDLVNRRAIPWAGKEYVLEPR